MKRDVSETFFLRYQMKEKKFDGILDESNVFVIPSKRATCNRKEA